MKKRQDSKGVNALKRKSLNGAWRLTGKGPSGETIDIEARVPGVVHLDLERAGIIPNPFLADNENKVQWVARRDWTYTKRFRASPETAAGRHVELVFEGLDTVADITLNARHIARTDNMFVPHRLDVKGVLAAGENVLEVRFLSPIEEGLAMHRKYEQVTLHPPDNPRPYLRKAQYSFGWDWGPEIATSGIWRGVRIETWQSARIESVYWRTLAADAASAVVAVSAWCRGSARATAEAYLALGTRKYPVTLSRARTAGGFVFKGTATVKRPQLWWPAGHGAQPLYDAAVVLREGDGMIDSQNEKIGIRTVALVRRRDKEGESFIIAVNGREIFCKGANWIPADSYLPRLTRRDYREWVRLAARANMNMLRVWGGGIYESPDFYRACDRYGVMVWQDFPFACSHYPDDKWFYKKVQHEATLAVKALRNHPSLVIWCGNNENQWLLDPPVGGRAIYHRLLPRLTKTLDPQRPYWPSSPYGGGDPNSQTHGDRHNWQVWSKWIDYRAYTRDRGRFLSEFGFQAPPPMESVADFGPLDTLNPQHPLFEHHNKQPEGPERLARFLAADFPPARGIEEFVHLTQLVQAEAIKTGVLHWRSRQPLTSGALYWQLNDCWPVCSWSAADYRRRPKALWFYTRRFFAPVAVRVAELDDGISAWVINDSPATVTGRLHLESMTFDGKVKARVEKRVRVKPGGVAKIGPLARAKLAIDDPAGVFLVATLVATGKRAVRDTAFLLRPKHLRLPDPGLKWRAQAVGSRLAVRITAKRLAYGVFLRLPETDVRFSDNFLTLLPGETATVTVTGANLNPREATRRLQVRWVRI